MSVSQFKISEMRSRKDYLNLSVNYNFKTVMIEFEVIISITSNPVTLSSKRLCFPLNSPIFFNIF